MLNKSNKTLIILNTIMFAISIFSIVITYFLNKNLYHILLGMMIASFITIVSLLFIKEN
ncbi:MAG: hypothetical protein J6D28_04590 [Bacilli bacterium]|nr:hypothetical protein [Bacilli bacterium]